MLPALPRLFTRAILRSISTTTNTMSVKSRLKGVVFDMDGTLTVPVIDFQAMYKAVLGEEQFRLIKASSPSGIDILHHIEKWSPDKQQKAYQVIADFEKLGMDKLQIMPGNLALLLLIHTF